MLLPLFLTIKQRRDRHRRRAVYQHELQTVVDRVFRRHFELKKCRKFAFYAPSERLNTSRVKDNCLWSGRQRGLNYQGFSRHAVKFFATRGRWLGLKKTSW